MVGGSCTAKKPLGTASFEYGSSAVLFGSSACVLLALGIHRLRSEVAAVVGVVQPRSDAWLATVVAAGRRARWLLLVDAERRLLLASSRGELY